MSKPNILVVEDDLDIQQLLSFYLVKSGFSVSCADTGEQGLEIIGSEKVNCMILDLMLPGMDGIEVCRTVRCMTGPSSGMPIIMLTARGEDEEVIAGLEAGADDYVSKPFSPRVLISRIKAALRRAPVTIHKVSEKESTIICGNVTVDINAHRALHNGGELNLTATEFSIIVLLMKKPGRVYSRDQIIEAVRGYGYSVTSRAVDVQIHGLRRKLGEDSDMIETVRGLGYRITC